jgi:2-C-methyl-D-erythritol 4-phosphate cytidylyltransferase
MKTTAIIPAAGTGTRLGTNIPKQFIELQGIPIIIRTIKLFDEISQVENIVIPIHKD